MGRLPQALILLTQAKNQANLQEDKGSTWKKIAYRVQVVKCLCIYLGPGFVFLQGKLCFKIFCCGKRPVRIFNTWDNNHLFSMYFLFFFFHAMTHKLVLEIFYFFNHYGNGPERSNNYIMHYKIRSCWNQESSKATCLWFISWVRKTA